MPPRPPPRYYNVGMPLPGGPSDKLGNRFELRWTVRRIVDLVTGRLQWMRIEPPAQDAIEFRCGSDEQEQAHQVKRGLSVGHWTVAALASAQLPDIRFHDLRHTAATVLAQGVDPRTIMETHGHSQISLTMNTYSHVLPALQEAAAAKLDSVLR